MNDIKQVLPYEQLREAIENEDYQKARILTDRLYDAEFQNLEDWKTAKSLITNDLDGTSVKFILDSSKKLSEKESSNLRKELLKIDGTMKEIVTSLDELTQFGIFLSQKGYAPQLNLGEQN